MMIRLISNFLYRRGILSSSDEIVWDTTDSEFNICIPLEEDIGRVIISMEISKILDVVRQVDDFDRRITWTDPLLFGSKDWAESAIPNTCMNCGEVGTSYQARVDYEIWSWFRTQSRLIHLCPDCQKEFQKIIIGYFVEHSPESVIAHKV